VTVFCKDSHESSEVLDGLSNTATGVFIYGEPCNHRMVQLAVDNVKRVFATTMCSE
jgi:hypothetical protein